MNRTYLKYFASLLLFGSNGIVASHIGLNSSEIVLLRTLIGSLLLISVFLMTKQKFTFIDYKRDLIFICISGIATGASWMFLYEAYVQVGVSIATLLYYCGPVVVMLLSPVLFKEHLTWIKTTGFIAVICGIFLINNDFNGSGNLWGILCGLLSALMYSVMVMANKKAEHIKGMENSVIQLVASFLTVAVFVGIRSGYNLQIEASDWIWILVLGLLNTGIGCYLYFSSIGNLPVQTVAICGYLEPVSAVLFSVILLHEAMMPLQVLGAVCIVGGAVIGELSGRTYNNAHRLPIGLRKYAHNSGK